MSSFGPVHVTSGNENSTNVLRTPLYTTLATNPTSLRSETTENRHETRRNENEKIVTNIAPLAGQKPPHITNRTGGRLLTLDSPTNQVSSPVLTSLLHNENIEIARSSAIPNPLHLSTPTTPLPSTTHPPLPEDSTVYDDDEYTTPAPTVGRLEYNREAEEYGRGEEGRKEEGGGGG